MCECQCPSLAMIRFAPAPCPAPALGTQSRRQRDQEQLLSELQHATRALQNAVRQSESIEGQAREGLGAHTRVNMTQAQLQAQPLLQYV